MSPNSGKQAFATAIRLIATPLVCLGSFSASLYAGAYLACIPLFAVLYNQLPTSFVHSHIALEADSINMERDFTFWVESTIRSNFAGQFPESGPTIHDREFTLESFDLGPPEFRGQTMVIPMRISLGSAEFGYLPIPQYEIHLLPTNLTIGSYRAEIKAVQFGDIRFLKLAQLEGWFFGGNGKHLSWIAERNDYTRGSYSVTMV